MIASLALKNHKLITILLRQVGTKCVCVCVFVCAISVLVALGRTLGTGN